MDPNNPGGATLADYLGVLRRRWWIVGLGVLLGIALAVVYVLVAPRTYQATAKVLVLTTDNVTDTTAEGAKVISNINLDTEAQLVKSQEVAGLAKTTLGTEAESLTAEQLSKQVTVTVPPSTTVLNITASGSTPDEAQRYASAFANAYLANRGDQVQANLTDQANQLKTQRDQLQTDVASLTGRLDAATSPSARAALASALNQATSELSAVSAKLAVVTSQEVTPGRVVAEPIRPSHPASPNLMLSLVSGAFLGLVLGMVAAFARDRRDGRVYDVGFLRRRLRVPVLVRVPVATGSTPEVLPAHSPAGQAFVQLRTVLLNALPDGSGVVVVLGSDEGSASDMLAANLAVTMARGDRDTVLVVADATSTAPAMLGAPLGPGLAEVMRKGTPLSSVLRESPSVSGLRIVSPGVHLTDEVEDLEGGGIAEVLDHLAKEATIVVVLAPPTSRSADAQTVARLSDGALLVVELGHSRSENVRAAVRQLELVGTPMPGAVVFSHLGAGPAPTKPSAPTARPAGGR